MRGLGQRPNSFPPFAQRPNSLLHTKIRREDKQQNPSAEAEIKEIVKGKSDQNSMPIMLSVSCIISGRKKQIAINSTMQTTMQVSSVKGVVPFLSN